MDLLYETSGKGLLIGAPGAEQIPVRFSLSVYANPIGSPVSQQDASSMRVDGVFTSIDGHSLPSLQAGERFRLRFGDADLQIQLSDPNGSFVLLQN